ncbi:MAG TPA: hypothetical protein VGM03_10370, partial [Phycisphaerae bacterium]
GWGEAESRHFEECHRPLPAQRSLSGRLRELWHQVIANEFRLFGPLVLLTPLVVVLTMPRRGSVDPQRRARLPEALLAALLAVQVLCWLGTTHLYARFAVVLLIPLALLGGRGMGALRGRSAVLVTSALVLSGAGFNLARFLRLYTGHFYPNDVRLPLEGGSELFTSGQAAGFEHLALINRELPPDMHILMLGDAKAFYFQRPVDYCVVFNRNPFVETVRSSRSPQEIVDWLRRQGYTHVLVNWSEIARLRRSAYGFPPEIQPQLFTDLIPAGLRHVKTFEVEELHRPYADLYEVLR